MGYIRRLLESLENYDLVALYEANYMDIYLKTPEGDIRQPNTAILALLTQLEKIVAKVQNLEKILNNVKENEEMPLRQKLLEMLKQLGDCELYFKDGKDLLKKWKIMRQTSISWSSVVKDIKKLHAKNKKLLEDFEKLEKQYTSFREYIARYGATSESKIFEIDIASIASKVKEKIMSFFQNLKSIFIPKLKDLAKENYNFIKTLVQNE